VKADASSAHEGTARPKHVRTMAAAAIVSVVRQPKAAPFPHAPAPPRPRSKPVVPVYVAPEGFAVAATAPLPELRVVRCHAMASQCPPGFGEGTRAAAVAAGGAATPRSAVAAAVRHREASHPWRARGGKGGERRVYQDATGSGGRVGAMSCDATLQRGLSQHWRICERRRATLGSATKLDGLS